VPVILGAVRQKSEPGPDAAQARGEAANTKAGPRMYAILANNGTDCKHLNKRKPGERSKQVSPATGGIFCTIGPFCTTSFRSGFARPLLALWLQKSARGGPSGFPQVHLFYRLRTILPREGRVGFWSFWCSALQLRMRPKTKGRRAVEQASGAADSHLSREV